jgi:hypothetical protein
MQSDVDGRFSVAPPNSNNSLDGIFAEGIVTRTYTQVRKVMRLRWTLSLRKGRR